MPQPSTPTLHELFKEPKEIAELANLVYVTEKGFTIERHPHGKGFYYTKDSQKITDKKELERFKALVIPPGWNKVRITHLKNGHLQVVGRDEKNRKVYRYHELWSKFRNQTKFFKMASFAKKLPKIRKQVEKDLELEGMPREKVIALVVKLLEETHIRIGNHYYAKKNKTYGLSTLRTKHLEITKDLLSFHFVGKKGKEHDIEITNKNIIDLVNQCEEIPGWELFQYYDDEGEKHAIDSGMVNEYIQDSCGDYFSAKDFRTWAATKIYFEKLRDLGVAESEKDRKHFLIEALDEAAEGLGNTRTVCKNYYVHPVVTKNYENDTIQSYFNEVEEKSHHRSKKFFSQTEEVLLEMMAEFEVNLKN